MTEPTETGEPVEITQMSIDWVRSATGSELNDALESGALSDLLTSGTSGAPEDTPAARQREAVKHMTPDQVEAAYKRGEFDDALGINKKK